MLRFIFIILLVLVFVSCSSERHTAVSHLDALPDSEDISQEEVVEDVPPVVVDSYTDDCIRTEYYYCPPLDAVWRALAVVDICNDHQILKIGPCEEIFECDPSLGYMGIGECEDDNGQKGVQDVYCEKGFFEYGPCDACIPEVCDGIDNDCDGQVDEGEWECEKECGPGILFCVNGEEVCLAPEPEEEICDGLDNDCDGEIDEFQLNGCGGCGEIPDEVCDGFDNNCDGNVDEDLVQECMTDCENGVESCYQGKWIGCNAQKPLEEVCNGFDDDCDGLVDEDLNCLCTIDMVGALFPCGDEPLLCGQGWQTCECLDAACTTIYATECQALCVYIPVPGKVCVELIGYPIDELCNNFDDNCNDLVDEGLFSSCYTGPEETLDVGICKPGEITCHKGEWGNYLDDGEFVGDYCLDEVTPADKDSCNGVDDNCDGDVDDGKEMEDTDVLFIVDFSGSMDIEIAGVMSALNMFASHYSDEDVIRWGLIVGPTSTGAYDEWLELKSNLVAFDQFMVDFAAIGINQLAGGSEMLYDAVYLAIHNIVSPSSLAYTLADLFWFSTTMMEISSDPVVSQFKIDWREDAHHVVILFTDEEGQSFLTPSITQEVLLEAIQGAIDLYVYPFSPETLQEKTLWNGKKAGWGPLTQYGGQWFPLTSNPAVLYGNLMQILDDTACGE